MKRILDMDSRVSPRPMTSAIRSALPILLGVCAFANAGVLPSGGHFVAGTGSIDGNGTSLTINQNTSRGVVDWNSFSIGNGNQVLFNNGGGATLNRVTGGNTSFILGKLSATGSVYLINPQGVVIGAHGVVSTGGRFVASTLDVDNASFMSAGPLTLSGPSTRRIVNLGKIGSTNGDVFLVSADEIDNFGSVTAPNGSAELASGKQVLLNDASTGQQIFVQAGSRGTIVNRGPIEAAQVSLQAADGNIFALAGDHTTIRATGTAERNGHVWLVANSGTVSLDGTVHAQNADGSGGTVDTGGARIELGSPGITPLIEAGQWNLTAPSFTVGSPTAASLSRSLNAGTSVNLKTTGGTGGTGDIDVASNLGWQGDASLTLGAYHTVTIDKGVTIANKGSGNLTLRADTTAIDNGGSLFNNGTIDWSKSTGIATLLYDMNGSYRAGTQLANAAWTAPLFSGLLTQMTAYQLINSLDDLNALQGPQVNYAGNYALGSDIEGNYNNFSIPAAGIGNQGGYTFTGQFDGLGHTIHDAYVGQGLFDTIGPGGAVRNVKVTDSTAIVSTPDATEGAGLLVRDNKGLIANVYVSGNLYTNGESGGGLAAQNEGTIERAGSGVGVTAYGAAGGLVGQNDGHIVQSYATGDLHGFSNGVDTFIVFGGGLVGGNNGTISQSYATGNLSDTQWETDSGGLVGKSNGTISQSFATGAVVARWWSPHYPAEVAGIATGIGTNTPDVYWNAQTTGQSYGGQGLPASNGLNTAQMSNSANFVGWNFGAGGVWAMPAGATHPVLAWQVAPR